MKLRYYLSLLLFVLLLNGCAIQRSHLQPVTAAQQQAVWQAHLAQLTQLTQFTVNGFFIYQDPQEKHQASFSWTQYSPDHYQLLLLSPFGTTLLKLTVDPTQSTLISQGKTYQANNPEILIRRLTGLMIPVTILQQWLLGIPDNATQYQLNQYALLQQATLNSGKASWQLTIPRYTQYQGYTVPQVLQLKHNQLVLKLQINHWAFPKKQRVSSL